MKTKTMGKNGNHQGVNAGDAAAGDGRAPGRMFVDLGQVRPDPDQPRKTFDAEALKGLADSIREQGIIQDLLVVHRPGVKVHAPDLVEKNWSAVDGRGRVLASGTESQVRSIAKGNEEPWYQIVDGERRWRAAQLAGLKQVPVAVREVNEKQKLALQVVANQQREALTALDEAAAYRKEIDSGRHTAESLYKALGISRGTLFSRLALNRLHPPVRAALEAGKISVSVAGLVSVVPEKKQQEELLETLTDEGSWQYPWSFRDVQREIEEQYCKQLKGSPFDVKKAYAGEFKDEDGTVNLFLRGACEGCRYRSGNIEGIDTGNPNICTRPKCYEAKEKSAWTERSVKAQASGQRVIAADEWKKVRQNFLFADEEEYIGGKLRSWKDAMGGQAKAVQKVLAQTPSGPKEVIARKDAQEAAKANGVKLTDNSSNTWRQEDEKRQKMRKQKQEVVDLAARTLVLKASRKIKDMDVLFLKKLCVLAIQATGCGDRLLKSRPQVKEAKGDTPEDKAIDYALTKLFAAEENMVGLLVDCLLKPGVDWEGDALPEFAAACKNFDIDLKAIEKGMESKTVTLAEIKAGKGIATKGAKGAEKTKTAATPPPERERLSDE